MYAPSAKIPRVIINADDFGLNRDINRAISALVAAGIVSSTSVMANMPACDEILQLAHQVGVGIHFNLTTGKPLESGSAVSTLIAQDGHFFDVQSLFRRLAIARLSPAHIEKELGAQVEKLIGLGITPDHADAHESLLKHPILAKIIYKVMRKYDIHAVRTYCPLHPAWNLQHPRRVLYTSFYMLQRRLWKNNGFRVVHKYASLFAAGLDESDAIKRLAALFQNLSGGCVEIVVHPGLVKNHDPSLGSYVHERLAEYHALMSTQFKHIRENASFELCRFSDL
ncbi:ChbG/HpnK family deacetylase [candidate division KSB1 bacterium]|nr:ChbG/HpnK family deacetylase [candidate division KSB1 bacterium]